MDMISGMHKTPSTIAKLQGSWEITTLEVDGNPMPSTGSQIVIKGDRFSSLGMGVTYEGKISVDDSKAPFAIDLKFTAGPEKGNTNHGIFEFIGEQWRLCLQMTGGDRPKKFATSRGSGLALETLQRAAKGKAKKQVAEKEEALPSVQSKGDAAPELEGKWAMASCVSSGQPLPAEVVKHGQRVARDNQITVTMMGQVMLQARYSVTKTTKPKSIDYELKGGLRQFGIYEFDGELLKVNFGLPGQERPADFSSAAGDGRTLTTWRRLKA